VARAKPEVVRTVAELRHVVADWRRDGRRVALVPTMGALHQGHVALVRRAASLADRTIVSIFVNPAQFAPHEDFDRYPRTLEADAAKLAPVAADGAQMRSAAEMYPAGFATRIVPGGAAEGLESDFRPHFFAGVATVCCKLFTQVAPDIALFGEKDYQQLAVVRQLVRDLDLPLEIVGHPTRREPDGLALSSRNAYLTPNERVIAPTMHRALQTCAEAIRAGTLPLAATRASAKALTHAGFTKVDYIEARDALTLEAPTAGRPIRLLAAAWLGKTRLIDNIGV